MATVTVERPREIADIKALIRKRRSNVRKLRAALECSLPAQDRRHLTQRLHGEEMSLQAWVDYLAKK